MSQITDQRTISWVIDQVQDVDQDEFLGIWNALETLMISLTVKYGLF